jgi:hypothetical protein
MPQPSSADCGVRHGHKRPAAHRSPVSLTE